jgi:hypothetical protein
MTDNITDANRASINYTYVITADYTRGLGTVSNSDLPTGTDMPIQEGLERIFRWNMSMSSWVTQNVPVQNGIFQIFDAPFDDLSELFANPSVQKIYGVFGLKLDGKADIIFWDGDKTFASGCLEDTVLPIPPFSLAPESSYQLFVQSNN